MSKPLDLVIFEPSRCSCPCQEPFWIDPRDGSQRPRHHFNSDATVDRIDYDPAKRLTDAELAAECWHFDYEDFDQNLRADPDEYSDEEWAHYIERRNQAEAALGRFATLPHYDEQDA